MGDKSRLKPSFWPVEKLIIRLKTDRNGCGPIAELISICIIGPDQCGPNSLSLLCYNLSDEYFMLYRNKIIFLCDF